MNLCVMWITAACGETQYCFFFLAVEIGCQCVLKDYESCYRLSMQDIAIGKQERIIHSWSLILICPNLL